MSEPYIWKIENASIEGVFDGELNKAIGVRYAKSARFEYPEDVVYTDEHIVANLKKAPRCPQIEVPISDLMTKKYDENCQYLNVYAPRNATYEDKLPVMVWIHGGSYNSGASDLWMYTPTLLVKEGIVVVSINYRMGFFGYSIDKFKNPSNLGLLDQISALRWINRYIGFFGGDKDNITVFGQSAGGDSVYHLIMSEGCENLFRNAIIQSAPFGLMNDRVATDKLVNSIASKIDESFSSSDIVGLERYLEKEIKNDRKIFPKYSDSRYMPFGVKYGVYPLPKKENIECVIKKRLPKINIMLGSTRRETSFYLYKSKLGKLSKVPLIGSYVEGKIKNLTKRIFNDGADEFYRFAKEYSENVNLYSFDFGRKEVPYRSCHCGELPLIFDPFGYEGTLFAQGYSDDELYRYGKDFRKIWSDFAKSGKVNICEIEGVVKFIE